MPQTAFLYVVYSPIEPCVFQNFHVYSSQLIALVDHNDGCVVVYGCVNSEQGSAVKSTITPCSSPQVSLISQYADWRDLTKYYHLISLIVNNNYIFPKFADSVLLSTLNNVPLLNATNYLIEETTGTYLNYDPRVVLHNSRKADIRDVTYVFKHWVNEKRDPSGTTHAYHNGFQTLTIHLVACTDTATLTDICLVPTATKVNLWRPTTPVAWPMSWSEPY
ncbi:hypothetical protein BDR26DRAFT_914489 [Obelidium mucronatum]|nr:hypothetical protein BDR26DRAFT_914489 [Obelidium mucronatum]